MSENGYKWFVQTTLNSVDGPQNAERSFLLATNNKGLKLYSPISQHNGQISVDQAFSGLPFSCKQTKRSNLGDTQKDSRHSRLLRNDSFWKLGAGATRELTYHVAPNHRPGTIKRFALTEPGENLRILFLKFNDSEIVRLQDEKILPKKWYIQRNRRLIGSQPSKTVTSHCLDELVHPSIDRALTVREVARLQGFPDSYDFKGGPFLCPHMYETQDKYEQIGDAVPPLLAYEWGKVINEILD